MSGLPRYRVEVFRQLAPRVSAWGPGIAGPLNQTGKPDHEASTFLALRDALDAAVLCEQAGASPSDVRVVSVTGDDDPHGGKA